MSCAGMKVCCLGPQHQNSPHAPPPLPNSAHSSHHPIHFCPRPKAKASSSHCTTKPCTGVWGLGLRASPPTPHRDRTCTYTNHLGSVVCSLRPLCSCCLSASFASTSLSALSSYTLFVSPVFVQADETPPLLVSCRAVFPFSYSEASAP